MNVKFKDGTIKSCTAPIEQKIFKNSEAAGWILLFNLTGKITSDELDTLLTTENVSELTFLVDDEAIAVLKNYNKITSSIIRYADNDENIKTEIQLTKGV